MSYASSFVHTKANTEVLVKEKKATVTGIDNVAVKKELATKILLFAAIIVCLVIAVNI